MCLKFSMFCMSVLLVAGTLAITTSTPPFHGTRFSGASRKNYPTGYFIASAVYALLFSTIGWRGMFMVGVIPALLVLYIRRKVPESPTWQRVPSTLGGTLALIKSH
jgi:SHS family lactate transporter-like MFS transporter